MNVYSSMKVILQSVKDWTYMISKEKPYFVDTADARNMSIICLKVQRTKSQSLKKKIKCRDHVKVHNSDSEIELFQARTY